MRKSLSVVVGVIITLGIVVGSVSGAPSFYDGFDSGSGLDPEWQLAGYSGDLPRAEGQMSPANHFSMTDNPGHLRYYVDPMTLPFGFVNDYATYHATYDYDPSLEISRSITGDAWTLETVANYYMPYTNGRGLGSITYFGDGASTTYAVRFTRIRDLSTHNYFDVNIVQYIDGDVGNTVNVAMAGQIPITDDDETIHTRLVRDLGQLTASWSQDGATWNDAWSVDMGTALDGLDQQVTLVGNSWFNTGGSYVDYDYVSLVPEPATLSLVGLGGLALLRHRRRAR